MKYNHFNDTIIYHILAKFVSLGVMLMKKLDWRAKQWNDAKSKKAERKLHRKNLIKRYIGLMEYKSNRKVHNQPPLSINDEKDNHNPCKFEAPPVFSIKNNPEQTITFFNDILYKRKEHICGMQFFIDSSKVEKVTVDALMFLIAIITDTKSNIRYKFGFEGNFPICANARKVYDECGFTSFVRSSSRASIKPESQSIQILQGKYVTTQVATKVCEFVQSVGGYTMQDTIPLYETLIELMGNTNSHAYKSKDKLEGFWYIFVEEREDEIEFVFLDTGLGIPTTVRRRWSEKIVPIKPDSEFITSALNGENRTQTLMLNRGKGLPQISDNFKAGLLKDVFIQSGKGCCVLSHDVKEGYRAIDYRLKLHGTLFCWKILKLKGGIECEN